MTKKLSYFLFATVLLFAYSCAEDEDPLIENEEEVITMVTLTLMPQGTQEMVVIGFSDPDGDGPGLGMATVTGQLVANAQYRGQLSFGNASGSINAEIVEEGVDHQVFYETFTPLNMDFAYDDLDANGSPIGLVTNVQTGSPGQGDLTITLRHEPDKASGAPIDNPANAGGTTDVAVTFTGLQIQ